MVVGDGSDVFVGISDHVSVGIIGVIIPCVASICKTNGFVAAVSNFGKLVGRIGRTVTVNQIVNCCRCSI
ncbi:hypothetical protein D3C86_1973330 [compost metagenome]